MRRVLVPLIALALVGCTGSGTKAKSHPSTTVRPTAQQRATAACRAAAPDDFFNAQPTTVAKVRAITGPPAAIRLYRSMLLHEPANGFAAWCWRMAAPNDYKLILVGPHGKVIDGLQQLLQGVPPPGPLPMFGPGTKHK